MSFVTSLVPAALALTLDVAPPVPPGRVAPLPADLIAAAIERRGQGDHHTAAWYYENWLAKKGGDARTRAAVQLALGLTWMDMGAPNLASGLFTKVRSSGTPVASWGAWYEAVADHERGRHAVAARECAAYRKEWPTGPKADECLVLMGQAWVAEGSRGPAITAFNQWLTAHPDSPREETMRLGIARAVANGDPRAGIPMLLALTVDHTYHSTGETAQATLDALAAAGHDARPPATVEWEGRRAAERKRCGFDTEAWALFQDLARRAEDDPKLAAWIDAQEDNFAWSTRQYDQLAASFAADYAAKADAGTLWKQYKALTRGGQWPAAVDLWVKAAKDHPSSGHFRGRTDLARAELLAGRYTEAREHWTAIGRTGGATGREGRWLAAYAAFRLGDHTDALKRLEGLISLDGWEGQAARYYRARTLDALGRGAEAEAQRQHILRDEPLSWYAALIRGLSDEPAERWTARDGAWPGPEVAHLPPLVRVPSAGVPVASSAAVRAVRTLLDWSLFAWSPTPPEIATPIAPVRAPIRYEARPDTYARSFLYDAAAADALLRKLADAHKDRYPDLESAADLARVGLEDLAAPLVARTWEDAEQNAVDLGLGIGELRQIFMHARDHHHTARFCWGATKLASNEEERMAALRCAFPAAHADALWRHGMAHDIDPLLAMGLMRQESVYRQWALSPVGAMGLMQVMPRTGSRVAALMGDPHYSPEQLEDSATNVRYGVWYLSRLMERFGGAFPLAVASYNGGPHNVSSWLRPWGDRIRIDDYVEQIPYPETRDYVKKVTGYYATYVALYGPPDARLRIPATVRRDDASIIDF